MSRIPDNTSWKRIVAGQYQHRRTGILVEQDSDDSWLVIVPGPHEDVAGEFSHKVKAQGFVERFVEYLERRELFEVEQ